MGLPRSLEVAGRGRGQPCGQPGTLHALCIQVGLDGGRTLECKPEVGGRAGSVAAMVANLEPPGETLKEVAKKCSVRVEGQEGSYVVGGGSLVSRRVMVVTGAGVLAWSLEGGDGAWGWA